MGFSNYKHSQYFLVNKALLTEIVTQANLSKEIAVLDIGAGAGSITEVLKDKCGQVYAIEVDQRLADKLNQKFGDTNVKVINRDFLDYKVQPEKFSVFSNIPFNISASIIKKLLDYHSRVESIFLIVQKETAQKFAGEQVRAHNSMLSVIYGSIYNFEIIHNFKRSDFSPKPRVNCVLLKITPRLDTKHILTTYNSFRDFVAYIFNKSNPSLKACSHLIDRYKINQLKDRAVPSLIKIAEYIEFYNALNAVQLNKIKGYYQKLQNDEKNIKKINRTRKDPSWLKY